MSSIDHDNEFGPTSPESIRRRIAQGRPVDHLLPPKRDPYDEADSEKWVHFGIPPETPFHLKVEKLYGTFGFTLEEIAEQFSSDVTVEQIEPIIKRLRTRWEQLGREMTEEDRILERGKQIAELQALRIQVERAYVESRSSDKSLLTAKLTITNKLSDLRDLEGKRVKEEEEAEKSLTVLEREISAMNLDDIDRLIKLCETELADSSVEG